MNNLISEYKQLNNLIQNKKKSINDLKILKKVLRSYENLGQNDKIIISILYGSMLGDGYANRPNDKMNTRVAFNYSFKNIAYIEFLHKIFCFCGLCSRKEPFISNRIDDRTNNLSSTVRFQTYRFKSLNELHSLFYRPLTNLETNIYCLKNKKVPNYVKIIPENIELLMDPLVLAIWFQDDGSFSTKDKYLKFATNGFSEKEVILLKEALKNKFNLQSNLNFAAFSQITNEKQYTLYLPKSETLSFISVVEPYIIPSMRYKLGL